MIHSPVPGRLGPALATLARVAVGVLWLREGVVKYHAHFGRADILLVVNGTRENPRVPKVFSGALDHTLGAAPGFSGLVVPAWEIALGVALILGLLTVPAACASIGTLMTYWLSDQLTGQYPLMVLLSAALVLCPIAAGTWAVRRRRAPT